MVLWLNGPYGVGKSTLADELHGLLTQSIVFDAEQVGNAIRDNLPESFFRETFEEYPLWLETCLQLFIEISGGYNGVIIVPMTLKRPESMKIFDRLKAAGVDALHIMLRARAEEILRRIVERGEDEDCWCARQIQPVLMAQKDIRCDMILDAGKSPVELAREIICAMKKTKPKE